MIITITGKPCSGKSEVADYIAKKYGFEVFHSGQLFRKVAEERGVNILELNRQKDTSIDKFVDDQIAEIGKKRFDDDMIIDSRTAWILIPEAFTVFIDVQPDEQARRFMSAKRFNDEESNDKEAVIRALQERFDLENERYFMIYKNNNKDPKNYKCYIDSTNYTMEETAEKIYAAYQDFLKERMKSKN